MIKKTRILINTNFTLYFNTLISFLFEKNLKKKFLIKLKSYLKTKNLVLCSQGRVAAYNIFKVLIKKDKNQIIISPYTLPEVISAIIYAGAKPVYVDLDVKTGLPDSKKLYKLINKKTAGIIITHLYSNNENIISFKKKFSNKLIIIEDTAINLGAKLNNGKKLGTLFDYGFYSFGIMKNLCAFNGGLIYSKNKKKLKEIEINLNKNNSFPRLRALKIIIFCMLIDIFYNKHIFNLLTFYILKICKKLKISFFEKIIYPGVYPKIYYNKPSHYNYNFSSNFSIIGIKNLFLIDKRTNSRIKKVKMYEKYLEKKLLINNFKNYYNNSFLEFPILLRKNTSKSISEKLFKNGFDIRHTWYVNNFRFRRLSYNKNKFINSELLHNHVLTLPTNNYFLENDIKKICNIINENES